MEIFQEGSITDVPGFKAAGVAVGLKKSKKPDFALIYSETRAVSAATFTQNRFRAAPVDICHEYLANDYHQAIVINSGNANACTGEEGLVNGYRMTELVANRLGLAREEVFVSSTGIIGQPLDFSKIEKGVDIIIPLLDENGGHDAATAIMTTDLYKKSLSVKIEIEGVSVTIGGMAKGSGMIHPNMATMIAVLTTDVNIERSILQKLFNKAVADSFNMISVDGDTSTNDTAFILSNRQANHTKITSEEDKNSRIFQEALCYITQELAKKIAQDGEGATKLVEVRVTNALSEDEAKVVAKSVVTSSLVKTAIFGEDGNWGRILCAVGNAGASFDPNAVKTWIENEHSSVQIVEKGRGADFNEADLKHILQEKHIIIRIDLGKDKGSAVAWGCDLSYDYVKINADYRT